MEVEVKKKKVESVTTCQRQEVDGGVGVTNNDDGTYTIEATHDKVHSSFRVTEWNARRILGTLSVVLGIPLRKEVKIDLGSVTATYVPDGPLETLGDKVAWHMGMRMMAERTGAEIVGEDPATQQKNADAAARILKDLFPKAKTSKKGKKKS